MHAFSHYVRHAMAAVGAVAITVFLMANALATGPQVHSIVGIMA